MHHVAWALGSQQGGEQVWEVLQVGCRSLDVVQEETGAWGGSRAELIYASVTRGQHTNATDLLLGARGG